MIFISLNKWKKKPTKEGIAESNKLFEKAAKEGVKRIGFYYTLGRYDTIVIMEGPDEKAFTRAALRWADMFSTETLVAIPREEAIKLIE